MNDNVMDLNKLLRKDNMKPFDFPTAVNRLIDGKKIHKLEWKDIKFFGVVQEGKLKLHKSDGKFYDWIVSEADLTGKDWIVID